MVAIALGVVSMFAAATDYLSDSGRNEVEALKAAYRANSTTPATYPERAEVAWRWLNALAMSGRSLSVNITNAVRPVAPDPVRPRRARNLDYYIKELILLDEQPAALGTLKATSGPFEARSIATVEQTWTVGSKAVQQDGGLLVAAHFITGYGCFQTDNPAANNYVSISTSRTGAQFVAEGRPRSGMHGGFRSARPALFFRLVSGRLEPGDRVTVTYGDQSGGGGGWRVGPASTDFLPVPIYVDFDADGHSYALPIQPIRVAGTHLAGVHAFAPSVVRPGQPFEVSVRARDAYYKRAKAPLPAFVVRANQKVVGKVAARNDAVNLHTALSLAEPRAYRLTVESTDGKVIGVGNPIPYNDETSPVFVGETHDHSGFTEGIGTPDRFMQWAKDDARLDFVTHSEHDIWMDDREWRVLRNLVRQYSDPGRFVAYHGYEWTT